MSLVLVGLPAAGKSTVGAILARRLGWPGFDSDAWVEERCGRPVADIFALAGEAEFRRWEALAVQELLAGPEAVVSLGGGAVLDPANRRRLSGHQVVWLDVSLATATRRAGLAKLRPLLLGDVRTRLAALEAERRPLYAAVATVRLAVDRLDPDQAADAILRLTGHLGQSGSDQSGFDQSGSDLGEADAGPDQSETGSGEVGAGLGQAGADSGVSDHCSNDTASADGAAAG
ncbi:MAG: shikimate kinase [Propionibacteriaceae bacterium]|nr:shikimate kinase [Propionibacteriaceae bacterium]